MKTQFLQVETADAWHLDGVRYFPQDSNRPIQSVDAWLLVHGTGGNFYSLGVLADFANELVKHGQTVVRINTRGHDFIAGYAPARGFGGAAFESLADCVLDVKAWIDELVRLGHQRIALVGHSLGGVKCLYSQSQAPHPNVVAVIGISPPRFCHANWQASDKAQPFRDHFHQATEFVASARGHELMFVQQPLPMWLTADGFLAKYGPHDEFDLARLLPAVSVPVLIILGTESVARSPAFESTPRLIGDLQATCPQVSLRLVPGADVGYAGQTHVPPQLALEWIAVSE